MESVDFNLELAPQSINEILSSKFDEAYMKYRRGKDAILADNANETIVAEPIRRDNPNFYILDRLAINMPPINYNEGLSDEDSFDIDFMIGRYIRTTQYRVELDSLESDDYVEIEYLIVGIDGEVYSKSRFSNQFLTDHEIDKLKYDLSTCEVKDDIPVLIEDLINQE